MKAHMSLHNAQTLKVRVCTAHAVADPQDPNVTCAGLEVRIERESDTCGWNGPGTGLEPRTELIIQEVRSRWKEPDGPYGFSPGIETYPFGPAIRLLGQDGFDLQRALQRALNQAVAQGLLSRRTDQPSGEPGQALDEGLRKEVGQHVSESNRLTADPLEEEEEEDDRRFLEAAWHNQLVLRGRAVPAPAARAEHPKSTGATRKSKQSRPDSHGRDPGENAP